MPRTNFPHNVEVEAFFENFHRPRFWCTSNLSVDSRTTKQTHFKKLHFISVQPQSPSNSCFFFQAVIRGYRADPHSPLEWIDPEAKGPDPCPRRETGLCNHEPFILNYSTTEVKNRFEVAFGWECGNYDVHFCLWHIDQPFFYQTFQSVQFKATRVCF